jgi:hypothetical protein
MKDNPAPTLKVKKRPPKKAGPKFWRLGMMRWFGMVRYPAAWMAERLR